jgi:uncharacterized protein (TIGR03083 family)
MFDLATATSATDRDFTAFLDELEVLSPPEWDRPVRCESWTVRQLARHVLSASRGQADALRRAATSDLSLATLDPPHEQSDADLSAALRAGREGLLTALATLPESVGTGVVPLPFGLLPTPVALQIVALEYGFHRNDLSWALDRREPLGDDIAETLVQILPGLLPMLAAGTPVGPAGKAPPAPCSYVLAAPSATLRLSYDGAGWSADPGDGSGDDPGGASALISGDDSALALFAMGRIDAQHPSLRVSDLSQAQLFKQYFPGP